MIKCGKCGKQIEESEAVYPKREPSKNPKPISDDGSKKIFNMTDVMTVIEPPVCKDCYAQKSREYTMEEVREQFLDHVRAMVGYWNDLDGKSTKERLEGLAFSILVAIDGSAATLPGFILSPMTTQEDIDYFKEENENYYPLDEETQSKIKCDIAGSLHDNFYKKRED